MSMAEAETPFGRVTLDLRRTPRGSTIVLTEGTAGEVRDDLQTRAAIYGAKVLRATRIVEVVAARPLDRLLPENGYVVPHDLVDLTRGHYLTFFASKGYGFLPQQTPFCPDMRAALVGAARSIDPASAGRGIVAALDGWDELDEARRWGAHLAGRGVSPAAFLARELEICYVPLCVLGSSHAAAAIIDRMLDALPAERNCPCSRAMLQARERGLVGDDWRTWL